MAAVAAALATAGCTRAHYRRAADRQATYLVTAFTPHTPGGLGRFNVYPDVRSRMFDPLNPDRPPMPPDDPEAHKLMHRVANMPGYRHWDKNGHTPEVDLELWRKHLPADENGNVVVDIDGAVQLAYIQSRTYQKEIEDLYLSALDVTFERFRFQSQFFATNNLTQSFEGSEQGGGQSQSTLSNTADLAVQKLYGGGGELVVGLANSIVWQFSGTDSTANASLLNFSFVQPLLRFGGRARVMERLTLAERTLLSNVRQMERFRQGFYLSVATGRDAGAGPQRRGGVLGGAGLQGFSGVGSGGFGQVGNVTIAVTVGAPDAGGVLGLLQDQQQIRNQAANVEALRNSLAQLEAAYDAGRIDRFQTELTRQSFYNAQSQLLSAKAQYQAKNDSLKVNIGLPPDLPLIVKDPLLDHFDLIDPQITALQAKVGDVLDQARRTMPADGRAGYDSLVEMTRGLRSAVDAQLEVAEADYQKLLDAAPERRAELDRLATHPALKSGNVDMAPYSSKDLDQRVSRLRRTIDLLHSALADSWERLEAFDASLAEKPSDAQHNVIVQLLTDMSGQLLELSLAQAAARVDSVTLASIRIQPEEALDLARYFRLDWMNARAALVDTWRLIEFNANALQSGLNLTVNGELGTTGNNPVSFSGQNGQLNMGVQFDAPLTRMAERNIYRQSLIEYEQARRNYMLFEDRTYQTLRAILRAVELDKLNFELRRTAVHVAIAQVDLARLRLNEPPRPREALQPGQIQAPGEATKFGATTARDVLSALGDLLAAQNNFLSVWVDYEVNRRALDFEMGTMKLDDRGIWIDPGPITADQGGVPEPELPEAIGIPIVPIEELPGPVLPDPGT